MYEMCWTSGRDDSARSGSVVVFINLGLRSDENSFLVSDSSCCTCENRTYWILPSVSRNNGLPFPVHFLVIELELGKNGAV